MMIQNHQIFVEEGLCKVAAASTAAAAAAAAALAYAAQAEDLLILKAAQCRNRKL
jgi:hypothetical protein